MLIYTADLKVLSLCTVIICFIWGHLIVRFSQTKIFRLVSLLLALGSLYIIMHFTVIGREAKEDHLFAFAAPLSDEFFREMYMNILLFLPLGLMLSVLIGSYSVIIGFLLSLSIESWQYYACTGFAQGTDVLCNTLGCFIGIIPFLIASYQKKHKT